MPAITFLGAVEIGLVYALLALGVFLAFRVLDVADLTVAGSFLLGASFAAYGIGAGWNAWLATGAGAAAGAAAGALTAALSVRLRVSPLFVSIFALLAINAFVERVVAFAQAFAPGAATIFAPFNAYGAPPAFTDPLVLLVIAILAAIFPALFLRTDLGLAMRVAGAHPTMARAQGVRAGAQLAVGLAISNALAALAGALLLQIGGIPWGGGGLGSFVAGLAAVLIGDAMLPRRGIFLAVAGCLLGALVYALAAGLLLRIDALRLILSDLTLLTGVGILVALAFARFRRWRAVG
jgi:putative ABC transport system permease protein